MLVFPFAPRAKTLPSGRRTAGPISGTWPVWHMFVNPGTVFPARDQIPATGSYSSDCDPFSVSTVSTFPFGSNVQPSSAFQSALPAPVVDQENVLPEIFNRACSKPQQAPSISVPSPKTTVGASPICDHPEGGCTDVQVPIPFGPAVTSKIAPA